MKYFLVWSYRGQELDSWEFDNKKEATRQEDFMRKATKCDGITEGFYIKEVEG